MSGENVNDRVHFEQIEQHKRFVCESYPDDYGNEWRIELLGLDRSVSSIVESPRIILNAIPEDHEDFPERHANAQRWAEEMLVGEEAVEPPPEIDDLPELWVHVSPTRIASPDRFHVVDMVFDPFLWKGRKHVWTFDLRLEGINFQIGIEKTDGDVGWSPRTVGTVGNATIWHKRGNPAEYKIESHVSGTYVER
jgi:hypothetical protein